MKLHADMPSPLNTVTAYGPDWIEINRRRFDGAVVVMPEGEVVAWSAQSFETLSAADFESLLARAPELVLLGTGQKQRFPHPRLTAPLTAAGVGVDVMNTHAACRTYNILMAEGRRVLAALLPD
jgi:uncharacterized protein